MVNYINDCFQHEFKSRKYRKIHFLNIPAQNEILGLILQIINKYLYKTIDEDEEDIEQDNE